MVVFPREIKDWFYFTSTGFCAIKQKKNELTGYSSTEAV